MGLGLVRPDFADSVQQNDRVVLCADVADDAEFVGADANLSVYFLFIALGVPVQDRDHAFTGAAKCRLLVHRFP